MASALIIAAVAFAGCKKEKDPDPVKVTGITVTPATLALRPGEAATLSATVAPANAADATYAWSSSNTAVATVDASGKVTVAEAAAAGQTATVTATAADGSGVTGSCTVTVLEKEAETVRVTKIVLNPATLSLAPGASETLAASVEPANATDKTVTWASEPAGWVDAAGKVTVPAAATKGQTATVTATAADGGGAKATCAVTVAAVTYTVTFDTDGGSEAPPAQTVAEGGKAAKPDDPAKAGFRFDGWYNGNAAWNFEATTVNADVTLTAHWQAAYTVTFDTDGGSGAPPAQTVAEGEKAVAVTDPTKAFTRREGLYLLPLPANETFAGWYAGDAKWDFATSTVTANVTLKARWTTAAKVDVTAAVGANFPAKALTYAEANAAAGKAFLMVLENDYTLSSQTIATDNLDLAIEGVGGGTLRPSLISMENATAKLTLGNGITLKVKEGGIGTSQGIIRINSGAFIMKPGSKITEVTNRGGNVVYAAGSEARFTMEGGEISGNTLTDQTNILRCAVAVTGGAVFTMTGGKISGNTSYVAGTGAGLRDVFVDVDATFNLKGAAEIGYLTLNSNAEGTANSSVTLTGAFTGKVNFLNLTATGAGTGSNAMENVASKWVNRAVLLDGDNHSFSSFDIGKITLGHFNVYDEDNIDTEFQIGFFHRIQETGTDKGKLVVK
jgi:uncharacterized repeat protein (TIGR02543 family)